MNAGDQYAHVTTPGGTRVHLASGSVDWRGGKTGTTACGRTRTLVPAGWSAWPDCRQCDAVMERLYLQETA